MDYAYMSWANKAPVGHIAAYYERNRLARIDATGRGLAAQYGRSSR